MSPLSKETREIYFRDLQSAHEAVIEARAEARAADDVARAANSKLDELERIYLSARIQLERAFGWRQ